MTTKRTTQRLERYERRYRALANQLAGIGYIAQGSLAPRFTRCGKPTCACQGDPPKLHGPTGNWISKRWNTVSVVSARGRAVHRLDRQRPTGPSTPHRHASGGGPSHRTAPRGTHDVGRQGFNRKLKSLYP